MFFWGIFIYFLITSMSNAQSSDLWENALRHGCYRNIKMLQPMSCNDEKNCFRSFYFKNNDIVPVYGLERFPVDTLMDVNRIYGGAVDNIYGFVCNSDQVTPDSLFNLLTSSELFRVNMAHIDAFAAGYSLICDGDNYLLEQQRNTDGSQEEGMVEKPDEGISFSLERITTTLDKAPNGETLFSEICVSNKTQHDLLVLPSKMLAQFGCTNAEIVRRDKSKRFYLPRIIRYCQNASLLVDLPDFYWFDNHVLIFTITQLKNNVAVTDAQSDNCFKTKYIAQVPLNFNDAREVVRHISQIEIEEVNGTFLVDAQVL